MTFAEPLAAMAIVVLLFEGQNCEIFVELTLANSTNRALSCLGNTVIFRTLSGYCSTLAFFRAEKTTSRRSRCRQSPS